MIGKFFVLSLFLLLAIVAARSQAKENETEARPGEWQEFVLSPEAKAAGIDGKLQIGLSISAEGKASNIRIFGGPMWPCGEKEPDEIEDVRRAVRKFLQTAQFHPATKNGKPRSSDVQITFSLSKLFTDARNSKAIEENLKNGTVPPLVEVTDIQRFALEIPRQLGRVGNSPGYRISEIQILVDENGTVRSAGGFRTAPIYLQEARTLACSAKFKPLNFGNIRMKMTGIIVFGLY